MKSTSSQRFNDILWTVGTLALVLGAAVFSAQARHYLGVIAEFLVALGVLVFVHEWGHYQFARWGGMKVNRFGIGFPPWIYTIRRNGIDYSIGALPIGGMVDIAGLGSEEEMVATAHTAVAVHAGGAAPELEPLTRRSPTEIPFGEKQFQEAALGWRFLTLFAGPMMNFVFAMVVFVGLFSAVGVPIIHPRPIVFSVKPGWPAAKAGLQNGDKILKVDGKVTPEVEDVQDIIFSSKAAPATLLVQRGLKQVTIHIQPIYADIFDAGVKIPSIGIEFDQNAVDFTYQHVTPVEAVQVGFDNSLNTVRGIGETLAKIATHKLTSEESNGIGGPVRIAQTIGQESQFGLPIILTMVGTLSVNLGLMNLLPFPALDGGRILFLAYEWVARRPFDPRKEGLVHFAGMIMLLSFMAFITLRDIYMIAQAHGH